MAAIVDDEDFEWAAQYRWSYCGKMGHGYARRAIKVDGKQVQFRMHIEIVKPPKGFEVDHCNGNTIDNRRQNLRIATHAENCRNQGVRITNKLGVKGVCLTGRKDKYRATITLNGKQKQIGVFETVDEARFAYDAAAKIIHGRFACVNGQRVKQLKAP